MVSAQNKYSLLNELKTRVELQFKDMQTENINPFQ